MNTLSENNLITFASNNQSLPCKIDYQLQQAIQSYLSQKGHTYATLARDIDYFVREQYSTIWNLVEDETITQTQLEKHIKDHTPSRSYLHDYAKGRPICFRYTNTIANFFNINYTIDNFDPSTDLQQSLEFNNNSSQETESS